MGKHAQLVCGPAGSGKSTYCAVMQQHFENSKRNIHVVNLDPGADELPYTASIDIRELITVEEAMREYNLGPNGGLVRAMEVFVENVEWFGDKLGDYADDYIIIDAPGQIELCTHFPVMRTLIGYLQRQGYNVMSLMLVDGQFMTTPSKFVSGALMCLSAMISMETSHLNIITKCPSLVR
jgi:GTPase SAR1 family protein